ncbi:hypothetical protein L249_1180 [Ophiocordyceps polyrhachis-furcata BCC 54312]|uniref:Uncharacterized protein n=1 Tax=Ophiocordyceps polyrhachis-furcata BCC 54312 TaxID=1330021 RepID=A0A367LDN0_9HYPO|nr:hypothetical protein L249_1180 [Ophiocordyceps polyrhachis-furcata BCC 54312]
MLTQYYIAPVIVIKYLDDCFVVYSGNQAIVVTFLPLIYVLQDCSSLNTLRKETAKSNPPANDTINTIPAIAINYLVSNASSLVEGTTIDINPGSIPLYNILHLVTTPPTNIAKELYGFEGILNPMPRYKSNLKPLNFVKINDEN